MSKKYGLNARVMMLGAAVGVGALAYAPAASASCQGKVASVQVDGNGYVFTSIKAGATWVITDKAICNLNETAGPGAINKSACEGMLSMLHGAMLSGRDVVLEPLNDPKRTCAQMVAYPDFLLPLYRVAVF